LYGWISSMNALWVGVMPASLRSMLFLLGSPAHQWIGNCRCLDGPGYGLAALTRASCQSKLSSEALIWWNASLATIASLGFGHSTRMSRSSRNFATAVPVLMVRR
jgi:hypothetical protein